MAKLQYSLFGKDAAGTIGNAVIHSSWNGRPYVKRHTVPKNPKTGLQTGLRRVFAWIASQYIFLDPLTKEAWGTIAFETRIAPMNAQLQVSQQRARRHQGWVRDPTEPLETTIDAPRSLTATPLHEAVGLTWARPPANKGDYTAAVYVTLVAGNPNRIENLRRIQTVTTLKCTITGLTSGIAYRFRVHETGGGGLIGLQSNQAIGIPL